MNPPPQRQHGKQRVSQFSDTRVPLSHLFANLEAGATIEEFLDWFEGVEDWQVRAVLKHLEANLLQDLKHEAAV